MRFFEHPENAAPAGYALGAGSPRHASRRGGGPTAEVAKEAGVLQLINAYRGVRGHLIADLDPLGGANPSYHPELDPVTYGLTIWDLDRQ